MDQGQFLSLIDNLNLLEGEFYILGSGSLLLHGIRSVANDLDLCVTPELFEVLKQRYSIDLNQKSGGGFYPLTSTIEVVINEKQQFCYDFVNGYPVEKLENILAFKQKRNLPKDQTDIINILKYLKKNSY